MKQYLYENPDVKRGILSDYPYDKPYNKMLTDKIR